MAAGRKQKGAKAKATKIINLAEEDTEKVSLSEFEVKDYDYKELQQPDDPFEKDLDYLLQNKNGDAVQPSNEDVQLVETASNSASATPVKAKNGKKKKLRVHVDDITKDIEEITFSSSEDEELPAKKNDKSKKKTNNRKGSKRSTSPESPVDIDEADELDLKTTPTGFLECNLEEQNDTNTKNKRIRKKKSKLHLKDNDTTTQGDAQKESPNLNKKKSKRQLNGHKKDLVPDSIAEGEEASADTSKQDTETKTPRRKKSSSKQIPSETIDSPHHGETSPSKNSTPTKIRQRKSKKKLNGDSPRGNDGEVEVKVDKSLGIEYIDDGQPIETKSDKTVLVGKNNELITVEKLKKKRIIDQEYSIFDSEANLSRNQRQKLQQQKEQQEKEAEAESPVSIDSPVKDNIDPIQTPKRKLSVITNNFGIGTPASTPTKSLAATPESASKPENPFAVNLRSTKTTISNGKYSENLSEVRPIKTIIGLNHKQVLNLSLSDVKIKAIISSSLTAKFVANILKFTLKYSHDIFSDLDIRTKFMRLCINVALYESVGFKKSCKEFEVAEYFGKYPEITLENTGTKLTPPTENIHQNQFDYSVLSFIGHVLIWAYSLQVKANIPTFAEKYPSLQLSKEEVIKNLGGDHLWDRLNRNAASVNTKRWKHINKFRESFGYYEDQFMLILRFLNVDDTIP